MLWAGCGRTPAAEAANRQAGHWVGDLESSVSMSRQQVRSPCQRWAIRYDPAPTLRNVKRPVLAINGEKDLQVAAKENIDGIARALADGGN